MTIFNRALLEANLQAFYHRYPEERNRISTASITDIESRFEIRNAETGIEFYENGVLVDSTTQGATPGFKDVGTPARIVVIEGLGLGSTFLEVKKNRLPETKDIIVIEPSLERFLITCGCQDFRSDFLDPSQHWIIGLSASRSFYKIFALLRDQERIYRISSRVYVRHTGLNAQNAEFFDFIEREWQTHIETAQNFLGSSDDAILGLKNTLENIDFIRNYPGVDLIKDTFKGRSALIISTGPSLIRSIDKIKQASKTCVLIAADASLKILLDHGITPHFVTTLERLETEPFFKNLNFPNADRPNLVACPVVPHTTLELYNGPKWVAYREYDYYGFFSAQARKGWLTTGHSVSHLCFSLAIHLGCTKIALVGQDLSYDPDTLASHPKGISYDEWSQSLNEEQFKDALKKRGEELFWVQGNLRDKVPTSSIYIVYLQELLDMVHSAVGVKVVNCTDGGARIGDIPHQPLGEFLSAETSSLEVFETIAGRYQTYRREGPIDVASIREYLRQARGYLDAGIAVAQSAEALNRIHDLRHLQTELQKDRPFFAFVVHQMARATSELEDEWNKLSETDRSVDGKRLDILTRWLHQSNEILQRVERIVPAS